MSGSSHKQEPNDIAYPSPEKFREQGKCGCAVFMDDVCGYDGPESWCDRTRDRCTALGNIERFDCAMPPLVPPWRLPKWEIGCGAVMAATLLMTPPWWIAAILYSVSAILIVPAVRQRIYYSYLHRLSAQDPDTST